MVRSTLSPNTKSVKMHESFRMETSCRARASNPAREITRSAPGALRSRADDGRTQNPRSTQNTIAARGDIATTSGTQSPPSPQSLNKRVDPRSATGPLRLPTTRGKRRTRRARRDKVRLSTRDRPASRASAASTAAQTQTCQRQNGLCLRRRSHGAWRPATPAAGRALRREPSLADLARQALCRLRVQSVVAKLPIAER